MSLNIFTELEITQDLKISNDLEILQNIDICGNILMSGNESTLNLKTIKSNRSTTSDPCGNYVDISGSALLVPRGTTAERMSTDGTLDIIGATAKAGMIMYDTSQNQFVGVIDKAAPNSDDGPELVWTGLGGVISTDQKTRIEATNDGTNSGLEFYTNTSINMFINQDGNVGIGDITKTLLSNTHLNLYKETTPTFLISGEAKGQQYGLQFQFKNDGDAKIYNTYSTGDLIFGTTITETTEPTERMRILANGNVGIGTTSPGAPLHVKSTTQFQGIFLDDENGLIVKIARGDSTGDPYIKLYSNISGNGVDIQSNGSSYFNGGNFGIGTTSPTHKLHIKGGGTSAKSCQIMIENESYNKGIEFKYKSASGTTDGFPQAKIYTSSSGSFKTKLHFSTAVGTTNADTLAVEVMTLDSAGNVGIGTDSPDAKLKVSLGSDERVWLNTTVSGGAGAGLIIGHENNGDSDTSPLYYAIPDGTDNVMYIGTRNNFDLAIRTHWENRIYIKKDGNVGIGTDSPNYKLDVNIGSLPVRIKGGGAGVQLILDRDHDNYWSEFRSSHHWDTYRSSTTTYTQSSTGTPMFLNYYSSGNVIICYGGGNVGIGTPSTGHKLHVDGDVFAKTSISTNGDITAFASSDKRLKNNITPIQNPLEKLKKINGYTFDWIEKKDIHSNKGNDIGVIAQEIEEVLPEITTTRDNGYKAVRYEKLTPFLISCIKDQQKQIENQQSQIENQQSQIDELKDLIKNK